MKGTSKNPIYDDLIKNLPLFRAIYCTVCGNGPKRVAVNRKYRCRCGARLTVIYAACKSGVARLRITTSENIPVTENNELPFIHDYSTEDELSG